MPRFLPPGEKAIPRTIRASDRQWYEWSQAAIALGQRPHTWIRRTLDAAADLVLSQRTGISCYGDSDASTSEASEDPAPPDQTQASGPREQER